MYCYFNIKVDELNVMHIEDNVYKFATEINGTGSTPEIWRSTTYRENKIVIKVHI